jgi:hypothetical protein
MKREVYKHLARFARFVACHIKGMVFWVISLLFSFVFAPVFASLYSFFLQTPVNDALGWLMAYLRLLQDGFRSGLISGTPFKNAQGNWGVLWQLGQVGQPFIYIVIYDVFTGICLIGGTSLVVYLMLRYRAFRRLKEICTYLRHPKSFWKYVSVRSIAVLAIISVAGALIAINPSFIMPPNVSKSSNGPPAIVIHPYLATAVTIIHHVLLRFDPSVLVETNMTGRLSCIVVPPENASWNISDLDTSTIVLNNTISPCSLDINSEGNGTPFMTVWFEKIQLGYLFEDASALKCGLVTMCMAGRLKNGDYLAGSGELNLVQ